MTSFPQAFNLVASSNTGTGQFSVSNGLIRDPLGNIFIPKGINVGHGDWDKVSQNAANQPLTTLFPGINIIRLNTGMNTGFGTAQALPFDMSIYLPFIQRMTGYTRQSDGSWLNTGTNLKIVVEMEDHDGNSSYFPGSPGEVAAVANEYTTWAAYCKGNPYVWFGTLNEMGSGHGSDPNQYTVPYIAAMSSIHQAIYNAIRATGNTSILQIMMGVGGSNPSTVGSAAGYVVSDYAVMTNIVWELHWYPANLSNANALTNLEGAAIDPSGGWIGGSGIIAAQTIQSADGVVPCIMGEWGAGNADPSGGSTAGATSAILSVQAQGHGSTAWQWVGDGVSNWALVGNGEGAPNPFLTGWGVQVATVCASTTT
jgi:hypothetical protein